MTALDARHVHEACSATDQGTAGKSKFGHRLVSAFGQRAGAIGKSLAAFECFTHQRMRLEALKFLERREIGIAVVEMNDEADRNQIFVEVIEERSAASGIVERPAECVLHHSAPMLVGRDLPKLL